MDADIEKAQMTIYGLAVLSAIPIVMFALWSEYFGRYLETIRQEKPTNQEEGLNPELEISRIRMTSALVILFQLLLLIGSGELRKTQPFAVNGILVLAILVQGWLQAQAERKLKPPTDSPAERLKRTLFAFVWVISSVAGYVSIVLASVSIFAVFAHFTDASRPVAFGLASTGAILGLIGGMAFNFAIGPLHLRRLLPASPLKDKFPEIAEDCSTLFEAFGLRPPSLWVVARESARGTTAFASGFRNGRGPFRPGLFLSQTLLEKLNREEIRAVIRHEISHLLLNHLQKRFAYSAGLVAVLTSIGILLIFGSAAFFPKDSLAQQLTPILGLMAFFSSFRWIGEQGRQQEIEADLHSVQKLGTPLADFASALRKLDQINGISSDKAGSMHPATALRIHLIEERLKLLSAIASLQTNEAKVKQDQDRAA